MFIYIRAIYLRPIRVNRCLSASNPCLSRVQFRSNPRPPRVNRRQSASNPCPIRVNPGPIRANPCSPCQSASIPVQSVSNPCPTRLMSHHIRHLWQIRFRPVQTSCNGHPASPICVQPLPNSQNFMATAMCALTFQFVQDSEK